jgi:hypothetical protein
MAFYTRQVKGNGPDKKRYPGHPGRGLGVGVKTHIINTVMKPAQQEEAQAYKGCSAAAAAADDDDGYRCLFPLNFLFPVKTNL